MGWATLFGLRASKPGEVCGSCKKFHGGERGAERRMRLLGERGSEELGQVASGSAAQDLY